MTRLKDIEIKGFKYGLVVSDDGSHFMAYQLNADSTVLEDIIATDDTLEKLKAKLQTRTREASGKIAVEAEQLTGDGTTTQVTFTGKHANGNYLMRVEGRKGGEQIRAYSMGVFHRQLTDAERSEWSRLAHALTSAQNAVRLFEVKTKLDVKAEIAKAIAAAAEPEKE